MSNSKQKPFDNCLPIDEHQHLNYLMGELYIDGRNTDVTFVLSETEQMKAHKTILSSQSPVFEEYFQLNPGEDVMIDFDDPKAFHVFLSWFYTCQLNVSDFTMDEMLNVFTLASYYKVEKLIFNLVKILKSNLSVETCFKVFSSSYQLGDEEMKESTRQFMCRNAIEVVKNKQFAQLPKDCAKDLALDSEFEAGEVNVLIAIEKWQREHPDENVEDIVRSTRFDYVAMDGTTMHEVAPVYDMMLANGVDLGTNRTYQVTCDNGARVEPYSQDRQDDAEQEGTGSVRKYSIRPQDKGGPLYQPPQPATRKTATCYCISGTLGSIVDATCILGKNSFSSFRNGTTFWISFSDINPVSSMSMILTSSQNAFQHQLEIHCSTDEDHWLEMADTLKIANWNDSWTKCKQTSIVLLFPLTRIRYSEFIFTS